MKIYRLVRSVYKDDFSGGGSYLYGGRWNSRGNRVLYATSHISLAILEIMVNFDRNMIRQFPQYHLLTFEVDASEIISLSHESLKSNWQQDIEFTRLIGDEFLKSKKGLIMAVPSAVIPEESNYLINIHHPDFQLINILESKVYSLDERLFTGSISKKAL